jgi:hypothetical protein
MSANPYDVTTGQRDFDRIFIGYVLADAPEFFPASSVLAFPLPPNVRPAGRAGFMRSSSTASASWPAVMLPACVC